MVVKLTYSDFGKRKEKSEVRIEERRRREEG
jgi:hypothetical protein